MASQDPLSLIPAGSEYNNLRAMLGILKRDFPEKYNGLANQTDRVSGWVTSIQGGERDDDQVRDDIAQHILGTDLLMKTYGIDKAAATKLILGGNEGGINFADVKKIPPPTGNSSGTAAGSGSIPPLRILTSPNLTWRRDPSTGKFYAQYLLPNTADQYVLFEADATQMKALFANTLPAYTNLPFNDVIKRSNYHFGGAIGEVEGTGSWENNVKHTISLGLDQENLPSWVANDPAATSLLWVKLTEERSDDWFYEQIQNLTSFKNRYPSLNKLTGMGLTVPEAMTAFGEFEVSLKRLHAAAGYHPDAITPNIVGSLLGKGYDLSYVQNSYATWKRMNDNAPALAAFNEVLVASGKTPLTGNDMYKFLQGEAPQEVYDIYEASSIKAAANATGFGDIFSANDSLSAALATSDNLSASQAYEQFSGVAQQALRLRHELDVSKFGLDVDDLIDVSFGRAPRSGKDVAEVGEALARATKTAEAQFGRRVTPYTGFTSDGTPQQQSLKRLRQEY